MTGYIRGLTAVRGVAAWWIVFFHSRDILPAVPPLWLTAIIKHGYMAVDLFFVLSGFVIALSYGPWFRKLQGVTILQFLTARLARIYPLHLCVLILYLGTTLGAGLLFQAPNVIGRHDTGYFFMSLVLVQNWGTTDALQWNGPAWSISTEWFAYLTFPLVVVALPRLATSVPRLALCAAACLASLALLCWLIFGSLAGAVLQGGIPRCVLEFCAGICLFRIHQQRPALGRGVAAAIALAACASLAATIGLDLPDYLMCPAAFAMLLFALAEPALAMPETWFWRKLEWLGKVSYSTYLIHFLLKIWIKLILVRHGVPAWLPFAVFVPALAVASSVLYHFIEVPGRGVVKRALAASWLRRLARG